MQRPKALIAALIASFLLSFVAFSTSAAANDRTTCDSREIAPDPAIAACTRLINGGKLTGRNLATTYNNRGWRYNLKGDFDRAIVDLNEALRRDPKMAYAYNNRGWAYYEKGEYDRAIADLNEALRTRSEARARLRQSRLGIFRETRLRPCHLRLQRCAPP